VGLEPGANRDAVQEALESLGLLLVGASTIGTAMTFGWEDVPRWVVDLPVVPYGGRRWREWVLFRDRLRADDRARDAYAALKAERLPE
jgi:GrpB-like predicted nucleotidyltransferase (UPF0157 family)